MKIIRSFGAALPRLATPRLWLVWFAAVATSAFAEPASSSIVTIDGRDSGRVFDGIGGVSAGASTRLLYDYPEPYRSDILDYLFKPNYGAAMQILKVEIGSDTNSTDGSEPAHQRSRDEKPNFGRGYEWWLMKEAKARNPHLVLAGLEWGAPGWMRSETDGRSAFWSQDNIDYILGWLDGAARQGLRIDYVGGWNEREFDAAWFIRLHEALQRSHPEVKVIGADGLPGHNWRVAKVMLADPQFNAAIDVVGEHSPGVWRSLYQRYELPAEARQIKKPLWASEQSALSHDVGGGSWARGLNRAYIDGGITASLNWAPVSAWYANLPLADTGLVLAEWPWSGHYAVGGTVWAYAHTSQFAQPGWTYLDRACGYLPGGASYVTLAAPKGGRAGRDYSIIIETMDAKEPTPFAFKVDGGLRAGAVKVWRSNLASRATDDDFIAAGTLGPANGVFSVTLQPGHLYTLTTTSGQRKGGAKPPASAFDQMPLPFREDFERYPEGKLARYFADLNGGFETVRAGGGRPGMAYRQVVPQPPIAWGVTGSGAMPPTTMFGDPRWWGDYEVSADVFLEQDGAIEVMGRIAAQAAQQIAGYHLEMDTRGRWRLYSQDLKRVRATDEEIASGEAAFPVRQWHSVALRMQGRAISVVLDGRELRTVTDTRHVSGNVALRVVGWGPAQFDNVKVTPTRKAPRFATPVAVSATSDHSAFYRGDVFIAPYAIDGRPESYWHTEFQRGSLPQAITLDLGQARDVHGLTYQPRLDNMVTGMITRYRVYLSADGRDFSRVSEGEWPVSTATKIARWPQQAARYVRLEAVASAGSGASAAEINVAATAIED